MSSNQLPEDVRAAVLKEVRVVVRRRNERNRPFEAAIDAIAPLIIEWARKDQAEIDEQIARASQRSAERYGDDGICEAAAAGVIADAIRAQFTPESTGGTTK